MGANLLYQVSGTGVFVLDLISWKDYFFKMSGNIELCCSAFNEA